MKFSKADENFMKRAIMLARKGSGSVSPNPLVGCVIVKNKKIISEGWHKKFGGDHAEIDALNRLKNKNLLNGATIYVNLEPCVHFGKTPPCCDEIVNTGIKRVVVGMIDPNPLVKQRGINFLRKNKICVDAGCLEKECLIVNKVFIKNIHMEKPFVAMKIAMSIDGKIATKTGESKWITSERSRKFVKKIRDQYDAILVGKNTVLCDDPGLIGAKKEPIRIVLDSEFKISVNAKIFKNNRAILVTTKKASKLKIEQIKNKGVSVKVFDEEIKLNPLLQWLLKEKNIGSLFVEGGSKIFGSFIDEKLVDKVYFFIAPKIIGGRDSKTCIGGKGIENLNKAILLKSIKIQEIGEDFLLEGEI